MNQTDDLFLGIFHHFLSRKIRISNSCTGIEQTEIIINLCRCPTVERGFLFVVFCSMEITGLSPVILSTSGAPTLPKITGICGKGLNVSPLPFGKDGIECQRRFTASAQSGYHRQGCSVEFRHLYLSSCVHGTVYINQFFFFTDIFASSAIFAKLMLPDEIFN